MTVVNSSNEYLPPVIAIPSALEITAITRAFPMVVTTTTNSDQSNTYIAGQLVRLNIPRSFNMWQANGLTGQITKVTGADLSLNIDSTQFDAFIVPASTEEQPASLSPSGSRNLEFNNNTTFIGFQSLNNNGN